MWTVDKFCFCCELEAAGLVFGWIGVVIGIIYLVTLVVFCFALLASDALPFAILLLIPIAMMAGFTYIYYMLIKGVKDRNPNRLIPVLITEGLFGIIHVIYLISLATFEAFFSALFTAALFFYLFICIYSLYVRFCSDGQNVFTGVLPTPYTPLQQQQQQTYIQPGQQMQPQQYMQPQNMAQPQNTPQLMQQPTQYSEKMEPPPMAS